MTSPLRSIEDVELSIKKRLKLKADICISVTPASRNPFFNMVTVNQDESVELVCKPEMTISSRQDAPVIRYNHRCICVNTDFCIKSITDCSLVK